MSALESVESYGRALAALKAFRAGAFHDVAVIMADASREQAIKDLLVLGTILCADLPEDYLDRLSDQILVLAAQEAAAEAAQ